MKNKVIINMEMRPRFGDVKRAADELGVTRTAVRLYLAGSKSGLGREKRERIVIKRHLPKGVA